MLILSKYKDYYDYLMGIYGVDSKLVLDRRDFEIPIIYDNKLKLRFFICGKIIDGFYYKGKIYYGQSIKKFVEEKENSKKNRIYRNLIRKRWNPFESENIVSVRIDKFYEFFELEPIGDKKKTNEKENCPIILKINNNYYKYPILKEWDMISVFSPEKIYKMLSEWLSNRITEKEENEDKRNDVDKLESKGFDKKRSFRPKMK